jgi:hypothetical protein
LLEQSNWLLQIGNSNCRQEGIIIDVDQCLPVFYDPAMLEQLQSAPGVVPVALLFV